MEENKVTEETDLLSEETQGELTEILLNTREQCQMVEQLIRNQIEVKDNLINRLHDELEGYKQDATDRFVEQLMKAVISVRSSMKKNMGSEQWQELSAEELRREYGYVLDDLTDLLEMQNVDEYVSEPGDEFDASIQKAIRTEATDVPGLDKKVKESLSSGYKKDEKVIITERVVVYRYTEE